MRVALAIVLVVASVPLLACSDETSGTPSEGDGGSADAGNTKGSGGDRAPNGCLLQTTGYTVGAKAGNAPRADVANAVDWTNVDAARTDDGVFATVTLANGQESSSLRVSAYGFEIPDSAETWGIEVELKRRAGGGGIEDAKIEIEIEGESPGYKFLDGPWPTTIIGTHAYGQAVDTWGVDLYPRHVNAPTFAAKVSVKRAANATGPVTASVDSLKVAVHFCPKP